jgi:hypothetical protein
MCAPVQVCDAMHGDAHENFFVTLLRSDAARDGERRKTNSAIAKWESSKSPNRQRSKLLQANLQPIALQRGALFFVTHRDKATMLVRASPFAASRCTGTGTRCTATNNLLHPNSAPNEATTSIWLKSMMVRRDLRGNTEPFENEH